MALPSGIGKSIADDMGKVGLGSAAPAAPDSEPAPPGDEADDGGSEAVLADIDAIAPGMGKLIAEYVEKKMAEASDEG